MRKVQLTIKQEEVAPATTSDLVVMNNGKTLKEELSTNVLDKFSREVTVVSSMEKVADGVKDGAYESLVFKGKSLVNLLTGLRPDTHSAWVRNGSSFTLNASGVLFLNYAALLKPNTTYTVVGELDFDVDGIVIGFREGNKSWEVNRSIGSRGRFAVLISTSAESTSNALTVHRAVTSNSDRVTLSNLMVLEGDWTNTELPHYFEGLGSCKMPILQNVGKNLFDVNMTNFTNVTAIPIDGSLIIKKNTNPHYYSRTPIHLKPNTEYTFKCNTYRESDTETYVKLHLGTRPHNDSLEYGGYVVPVGDGTFSKTFTTNSLGELYINGYTTTKGILLSNIQLEEASTATSYEDHKTNILRTSEEIVLREVGGVQDTYNPLTGEYVQRIGEVVLDGSENEWEDWSETSFVLRGNYFSDAVEHTAATAPRLKCNNMVAGKGDTPRTVRYYRSPTVLWTMVGKNNGETLDQFKTWLSQNPTTIQYILAEPVTTIVKPSTIPFAYENGHVILESGFEGQSLLPELKYSAPASKSGVLSTTSKTILKHEQRLHKFEDLLLRESILMDYRLMLTMLDSM